VFPSILAEKSELLRVDERRIFVSISGGIEIVSIISLLTSIEDRSCEIPYVAKLISDSLTV